MNDGVHRYKSHVWWSWLILSSTIILLGIEFSLLIPQAGFAVGIIDLASSTKLYRSARVGMSESDIRNALGAPRAEWQSLSQVRTGGYSPRPSTPVTGKVLIYQISPSLLSDGERIYIYIDKKSMVSSIVFASS